MRKRILFIMQKPLLACYSYFYFCRLEFTVKSKSQFPTQIRLHFSARAWQVLQDGCLLKWRKGDLLFPLSFSWLMKIHVEKNSFILDNMMKFFYIVSQVLFGGKLLIVLQFHLSPRVIKVTFSDIELFIKV